MKEILIQALNANEQYRFDKQLKQFEINFYT